MISIVCMIFLEFANICLPTKILTINECNCLVGLIRCCMLLMCIESSVGSSNLGINLNIGLFNWLSDNLILRSDYRHLDSIGFGLNRDCFFHIIMSFLLTVEAGNFVISHSISLFCSCWHGLHETYHCLVALRVELSVISGFNISKLASSILLGILGDRSFDVILEVGEESETIFEFYCKRLVVNWRPSTSKMFSCA